MTRTRIVVLLVAVTVGATLAPAPAPAAAPPAEVLAPADLSQANRSGVVPVTVRVDGSVPRARLAVQLVTGSGSGRRVVDLTTRLLPAPGGQLHTTLGPTDLERGPSVVRVGVLATGPHHRFDRLDRSRFSWEPSVDGATAGRCDVLDPQRCLLPFPNDLYTVPDRTTDTGLRVNLAAASMPENIAGTPVDPSGWNGNDGFSPGSMILTHVPNLDLTATGAPPITDIARSLDEDSPIVLLDAATGERHPFWAELDANADTDGERALLVRPAVNLAEGHRYVIALRRLRRADGSVIAARRGFTLYRDKIRTYIGPVEARRPHMESLFETLASAGVRRSTLYLAWDFTVASERNLSERLLHIRDDAFATLGGDAPDFTVDTVEDFPDPVAEPQLLRRVTGSFTVPSYLTGDGSSGNRFTSEPGELPLRNGDIIASFVCNIPRSVIGPRGGVVPARAGVYGHGLLGSNSEVNAGNVQDMSVEHNFVFCATNWIGMANEDIGNAITILGDFSQFPTLADRVQQGILNTLFLGRLMIHAGGFASDPAFRAGPGDRAVIDRDDLFYDGNSQGAIIGGAATAVAQDWTKAVLGVPGMNYSTLLNRSVDFDTYSLIFEPAYPSPLDRQLVQSIVQMLWDRAESNGYAHHMTDDPYPGTPAHRILLHVAFSDHQVANVAAEVEARTIGAHLREPALAPGRHTDVDPYWGIARITRYPFRGSAIVLWDSGNEPPPTTNTPPRDGDDPHEHPRRQANARVQKAEFLRTFGTVIDVCGGDPCTAS